MRILESQTVGKHGDLSLNEDGLFVGDAYVAVIDGVTSKAKYNLRRPSPGVLTKETLLTAPTFDSSPRYDHLSPLLTMPQCLEQTNSR
ncbi:hypothetical protein BLEM_2011 [Bifidobacterium lemurum]|uniref:Uncharacterized protein n=1 Tax=Bifidobacterium lemurum TaxID=1603886 RepID=A0A261FMA7_9BIFI|nr:hypothetical protein BLEM_2011 [Bifidobacterium lemurum]